MNHTATTGVAASDRPLSTPVLRKGKPGRLAKPKTPISREAQRIGAAILEVLAGVRSPTDAATALGIAVPQYYLWEQRALQGLIAACQPRRPGEAISQRHQIAVLQKEVTRLKQDCARQQALVRVTQRTIGLSPPAPKSAAKPQGKKAGKTSGKKSRRRPLVVRALRAAAALRTASTTLDANDSSGVPLPEVLQPSVVDNALPSACPQAAAITVDT
jgi:hypothetical protein